ncbi:MAG: proton-conducting transporter transmembrane domain-containing protein [Candidatus Hecatellaceae archaeon]
MFTWVIDILVLFAIAISLAGALARYRGNLNIPLGIVSTIGFGISIYFWYNLYLEVQAAGGVLVLKALPALASSCLRIDMLSLFFSFLFLLVGFVASFFSMRYMEHDTGHPQYYALLLSMVAGMVGVSYAGDFFTLFFFWELMAITSYVLVAFRKHLWEPVEAGFKYLVMSAAGSALMLLAIALLYGLTGITDLAGIASAIKGGAVTPTLKTWLYFAIAIIVAGFGVKASIVPLHTWLPDAHPAAPTPISAMLSGVVIKTGVYAIMRMLGLVVYPAALDWTMVAMVVAFFAALTMTVGNVMALLQEDVKRLLAYSSIAHIGYITLGISVGLIGGAIGFYGYTAGLLHTMNHAIMKGLAFLAVGAFIHAAGTRKLSELVGIGHRMRAMAVIFTIAVLALSGVPPTNGFISELMLVLATVNAGLYILVAVMLANILIGFGYYLRLLYIMVWQSPRSELAVVKGSSWLMLIPTGILAALCILIGVYPAPFLAFASQAAQALANLSAYTAIA